MKLTLKIALLLQGSLAWAGSHVVGNGGDVVLCQNSNTQSVELLDYFEAKHLGELSPIDGSDPIQVAESLLRRYEFKPLIRGHMLLEEIRNFRSKTQFVKGRTLTDIPDSLHLSIPAGCQVHQAAIQGPLVSLQYPDKYYLINEDLWSQLDTFGQAGLVVHEVLYREASVRGAKNSIDVRNWVGSLARNQVTGLPSVRHETVSGINADRTWGPHGLGTNLGLCEAGLSFDRYVFAGVAPTLEMLESAKPRYLSSDAIERCFGKEVKAWAVDPASLELVALNFEILANKEVYAHDRGYWLSRRFVMQVRTIDDIDYPLVHPFVFKSKAGALTQIGFSSPGPNQIGPQVSSLRIDHSEVVPGQGSVSGWDRVNLSSHYELPGNEGFLAVLAGNTTIQAAGASLDCQSGSKLAGAANDGWSSVRQWVFLDGCRSNDALATAWERNRVKAIAERSMTLENGLLQFGLFTSLVHPPQSSWQHFLRDPLSHVVLKRYIPNDPTTLEIPVSVTFNEHQTLPIEAIDFRIEPKWSSVPGQGEIGTLYPAVATIPSQTLLKGKSVLNEEFEMVLHSATQVDLKSDPQNRNRELILNGSGKLEAFAISTGLNVPICNKSNWRRKPISSDFPLASMKGIYLRSRVLDDAKPKLHCFEQGT